MRRLSKFTGKVLTAKSKTTSSVVASSCTRAAVAATRRAWTHSSHEKARAASRSKDQAERLPRPLEPSKLSPLSPLSRALSAPGSAASASAARHLSERRRTVGERCTSLSAVQFLSYVYHADRNQPDLSAPRRSPTRLTHRRP